MAEIFWAHSKMVLRLHGMEEVGVRFSVGPHMNWFQDISNKISQKYPRLKFLIGICFILIGLIALVTPLTPGSWLALIGLELIGIRTLWIRKGKRKS